MKRWGNTLEGVQSADITVVATRSRVAADVATIHKVLDKCFKRLQ